MYCLVQRVNWLRAKARVTRWTEQFTIICDQMGNTIRFFRYREKEWLNRATRRDAQSDGHRAYAYMQADMWAFLAQRAETKFGVNAV